MPGLAKEVFHTFVIGVYFFPLLGGWLADRFLGKYRTILWLSLVYCAGHACLAAFDDNRTGFYTGLFLIALGSGGIKPLRRVVRRRSVRPDEQAPREGRLRRLLLDHQLRLVLRLAADADLPAQLRAGVAFGIPGVLMFIATVVFWAGRQAVRARAARPAESGLVPACRAHGAPGAQAPGQGRPGLTVAAIGAVLALGALALMGRLGFVASVCLALVLLLAFGGAGTWLQLDRARAAHPRMRRRRRARGAAHPDRVRAGDALLVAVRPEGVDVGPAGGRDDSSPRGSQSAQMQALNPRW